MSSTTMSRVSPSGQPRILPLLDLLTALDTLGVTFRRCECDLALKGGNILTAELLEAVAAHKTILLRICDCRAELTRLHNYIVRLRYEDPPRGTREQAFTYLRTQISKLEGLSVAAGGTEDGWPDPADPFADAEQMDGLRVSAVELMCPDAPYPAALPRGCVLLPEANFDVFAAGRLYNGMISTPLGRMLPAAGHPNDGSGFDGAELNDLELDDPEWEAL